MPWLHLWQAVLHASAAGSWPWVLIAFFDASVFSRFRIMSGTFTPAFLAFVAEKPIERDCNRFYRFSSWMLDDACHVARNNWALWASTLFMSWWRHSKMSIMACRQLDPPSPTSTSVTGIHQCPNRNFFQLCPQYLRLWKVFTFWVRSPSKVQLRHRHSIGIRNNNKNDHQQTHDNDIMQQWLPVGTIGEYYGIKASFAGSCFLLEESKQQKMETFCLQCGYNKESTVRTRDPWANTICQSVTQCFPTERAQKKKSATYYLLHARMPRDTVQEDKTLDEKDWDY